jgi:hypothetical protein
MAENLMEHRVDNRIDKLLQGTARGSAVALRGCPQDTAAVLLARFSGSVNQVRLFEPCRAEHPHSAFLRKPVVNHGRPAVQTTLFAPGGKLNEERSPDGEAYEHFIKKVSDFDVLCGHLRDVELYPAKAVPMPVNYTTIACLGLTPLREMETHWAGAELIAPALMAEDGPAASCMRKLERQLHRRCEEACRTGSRVAVLRDMAAEPLPDTYMLQAGRHIEWLRHNGLAPYVEVSQPNEPLLAALAAARAGARIALGNPALHGDAFALPEDMRLILDLDASVGLGDLPMEQVKVLLGKCCSAVILLDCFQAEVEDLAKLIEGLLNIAG